MGYRIRVGKFPKSQYAKYKGKSYEELCELYGEDDGSGDKEFAYYRPPEHVQLYQIGSGISFRDDTYKPFYDFELNEDNLDSDYYIMDKAALEAIIKNYEEQVALYFTELMERADPVELRNYVSSKKREWTNGFFTPIQWDTGDTADGEMSPSYYREYAVFNLLHILKTFDWDNDFLIYNGW
jgi:hypothetical protein